MSEFVQNLLIYLGVTVGILSALFAYVSYKIKKSDKWNSISEYWEHSEGTEKPIWKGVINIIVIPLLVVLLLFTASKLVKAEEIKYLDYTSVFIGLDYTQNPSPFCEREGVNDRITSNMGVKQNILYYKRPKYTHELNGKYTHHSCAINPDSDNSYDAIGIVYELKFRDLF